MSRHADAAPAKDQPLIDDIRLLGRLLGDVIREHEGEDTFALIERIRQLSVAFRRHADTRADRELKRLLHALSDAQAVSVIRAFTYFSHLANLAKTATTSAGAKYTSARGTSNPAAWPTPGNDCAVRPSGATPSPRRCARAWCRRC
jgi:phosphoenolpyruvate carboxylase